MPVSKRDKKVSLTKTTKKGKEMKQQIVDKIRDHLNEYKSLYVFTVNNMRTGPLQEVRDQWRDSRFFYAKKKVMALALGRSPAAEMGKNLHKLSAYLKGQCGLLFTNQPTDYVVQWFRDYSKMDYARSGFIATETVTLPAGPLEEFSFSLEPRLRQLGMPTQLQKGKIMLREDFTVCAEGQKLTPEQADILVLINKPIAEFRVSLICRWSSDGSFEKFKVAKDLNRISTTPKASTEKSKKEKSKETVSVSNEITQEDETHLNTSDGEDSISNDETVRSEESNTTKQQNKAPKTNKPKINTEEVKEMVEGLKEMSTEQQNTPKKLARTRRSSRIPETILETPMDIENSEESEEPKIKSKKSKINSEEVNGMVEELKDISTQQQNTPKKLARTRRSSRIPETISEATMDVESREESEEPKLVDQSPVVSRENPRRSMRTPKPIKRSPEQKMSVKKLTESAKQNTPKQTIGTPKKTTDRKRVHKALDM